MARWTKLGIIAGGGDLPLHLAQACAGAGRAPYVVRLQGIADAALSVYDGELCGIAEAGRILRLLKNSGCDAVVLAGAVQRPNFADLKPDWRGVALLPKVIAAGVRGDAAVLDVLVETIEAEGFIIVAAEEVAGALSAQPGVFGVCAPSERDHADIAKAAAIVRALGAFDVGQGAVVREGQVLAIEAAEGTDLMLERCVRLTVPDAPRAGVLVKRPKPGQELRVDLPAIGPETVRRVSAARLAGIAVEAGAALVIDYAEVTRLADEAGIFVYGFERGKLPDGPSGANPPISPIRNE